jgi:phage recombination protein Bet
MELNMNVAALRPAGGPQIAPWHQDNKMLALVKRTTGRDCTQDEFDEFIAVCRDLNLSPLRKQIYCFIFNKSDPENRKMTLVVGIDGSRAIAARTGNYRPDDRAPEWVFKEELKGPANPNGIEKCTVGIYHRPTHNDPFERIVHTVYWDEYAPIVKTGDADAYEWVPTGRVHPEGHKRAGQSIDRKQLRPGASANIVERVDPKKEQWIRSGRNMIAKCAEMGALRKGWPEDLSRLVIGEETDRSQVLEDVEYTDLTPSEMATKAETDTRLERIGGPALFATFDYAGTLERVPHGRFADRMLAATAKLEPKAVAALVDRNREALKEFWAHNKNDALELRKILEQRSGATSGAAPQGDVPAKAAAPQLGDSDTGAAVQPTKLAPGALTGELALKLKTRLLSDLPLLNSANDFSAWKRDAKVHVDRLPSDMQREIDAEFQRCQGELK